MRNQLDIVRNEPRADNICSYETNLWSALSERRSEKSAFDVFVALMNCCSATEVVLAA